MKKRHFSWKNFISFVLYSIAVFLWLWVIWSVIDINLHNLRKNDNPSKYNAVVIFYNALKESEVNTK